MEEILLVSQPTHLKACQRRHTWCRRFKEGESEVLRQLAGNSPGNPHQQPRSPSAAYVFAYQQPNPYP